MKCVILLLYQYSKYFAKEIILFVQILILIIVGYLASNHFISTYQINNCAESVYSKELVFFDIHGRIITIIEGFAGFDESEGIRLNNEISDSIMQFTNVSGIGEIGLVVYRNTDNLPIGGIAYNSGLIKNTTINLRQGNWYDLLYKSEYIPIIVSEDNGFGLKYNDILDKNILFFSDDNLQIRFKVVGVIDNNSKLPIILEGGTMEPAVDFILNKVSNEELIILNSDHLPQNTYSMLTSKLIFLDGISSTDFIEKYSASVSQYGRLAALNDMKIQQWVKSALNNREDIIIFFSLLFLFVFSVIGYNLLEMKHKERLMGTLMLCGMSKRRLTIDRFISNLILYFCAYIVSIPICIKIYYDNEVFSVYLLMIAALFIGFMFLTCFITNHLISKFDLSNIIRSE